jgi:hypothetical protein
MKEYKIETINDIEYVVINLIITDYGDIKRFIKENFEMLEKPHFKFIVYDNNGVIDEGYNGVIHNDAMIVQFMKKYKLHNEYGPAQFVRNNEPKFYLNDIEYNEDEYINELRNKKLNNILDDD